MMGSLREARVVNEAPWPGATPEEDAAYDQQTHMGNIEFEMDVARHMGPFGREALNVDRAEMVRTKTSWTLKGLYAPSDSNPDSKAYAQVLEDTDQKIEPDMVYAIGPSGAIDSIWTHEFIHRYYDTKDMDLYLGEERTVILHTAFRSNSPDDWESSVRSWAVEMLKRRDKKKGPLTFQKVSDNLKEMLRTWEGRLIKSEVDAAERQNIPAKRREPIPILGKNVTHFIFDSLKKDSMETLERRKKHWHFKSEKQEK